MAGKAYEDNTARITELQEAFDAYRIAQEEVAHAGGNISEVIGSITHEVEQLTAAYNEAYDAALESVAGQFKLWDEAADVVATSAGEINHALASQTQYWSEYQANLDSLTERGADIEGLSELLATFVDGSEGSVNMIAGLAMATDAELRTMVDKWQELQAEQEMVAASLATLGTDFATAMQAIQVDLESAIGEMSLSEEAALSGKSTIEGFIRGSEDMLPAVSAAYLKIAQAAVTAIDTQLQIKSPSQVFADRGEYAMTGFVGGVVSMEPEVMEAMSEAAMAGANAFSVNAQFTHGAIYPRREISAIAPTSSNVGGARIPPIEIVYNITGVGNSQELRTILQDNATDLQAFILDTLENHEIDRQRRAYI